MRILYYNWTPLGVPNVGGGVAVYMHNLLDYLQTKRGDIEVLFLSSGYYYDKKNVIYIKELGGMPKSYSIVNSPSIAPLGNMSYQRFAALLKDETLVNEFDKFIAMYGSFDVIHFQTLEGLSPKVLSLKTKYPHTKFIHSVHDYGCFCPNVKFWTNKGENCVLKNANCFHCHQHFGIVSLKQIILPRNGRKLGFAFRIFYKFRKESRRLFSAFSRRKALEVNSIYQQYRKSCVDNINKYIDVELAVSERVKEIVQMYGVKKEKVYVNYIGTKVAETSKGHCANHFDGSTLTLLYMGYSTKAKGFFTLLEALELIDPQLSKHIKVKLASKIADRSVRLRIDKLRVKFKNVIVYDGYSKKDFPIIFEHVNLGIVPPLWEDNLPQVTIEMIANGIPVITSRNGGAKELNSHPDFVFEDTNDLVKQIAKIYHHPQLLDDYWYYAKPLTTMEEHVSQLMRYYQ